MNFRHKEPPVRPDKNTPDNALDLRIEARRLGDVYWERKNGLIITLPFVAILPDGTGCTVHWTRKRGMMDGRGNRSVRRQVGLFMSMCDERSIMVREHYEAILGLDRTSEELDNEGDAQEVKFGRLRSDWCVLRNRVLAAIKAQKQGHEFSRLGDPVSLLEWLIEQGYSVFEKLVDFINNTYQEYRAEMRA